MGLVVAGHPATGEALVSRKLNRQLHSQLKSFPCRPAVSFPLLNALVSPAPGGLARLLPNLAVGIQGLQAFSGAAENSVFRSEFGFCRILDFPYSRG